MYLVFALLAPIGMFGLISGLTWFEDRMLGPAVAGREVPRTPRAEPDPEPSPEPVAPQAEALQAEAPQPVASAPYEAKPPAPAAPIPLQPVTTALTPLAPAPLPRPPSLAPAPAPEPTPTPVRHHLRRTLKRGRGLRAA